jgi:hypothetical protein
MTKSLQVLGEEQWCRKPGWLHGIDVNGDATA